MYSWIRPLLFKLDAEQAHEKMKTLTKKVSAFPFSSQILKSLYTFEDTKLHINIFGKEFKNPVGLAAGFDKNAEMLSFLGYLGFGFAEFGTVTFEPQPGNPRPRLFRLVEDAAIINRMGFNGNGAETLLKNFSLKNPSSMLRVINIGKNKNIENKNATKNYLQAFQMLLPHMDMCVVNVSSPNTPDLRELQDKSVLTQLLQTLVSYKNENGRPELPILVKIAPDLNDKQLLDVIEVVKSTHLNGIVATNTTTARPEFLKSEKKFETGGLSGLPLQKRSTEVIKFLYTQSHGTIPIIGVGGIFTAEDAYEKIKAGASLVEIYTGLIYEGPSIVKKINKGLVKLVEQDGFTNIQQAVGKNINL